MASSGSSRHSPASTRSAHSTHATRSTNTTTHPSFRTTPPLVTSPTQPHSPVDSEAIRSSPTSDRPIRPLPKRRLRDRLSTEQADALIFPSVPERQPLFSFPYPSEYDDRALAERRPLLKDKDGQPVVTRAAWDDQDRFADRGFVAKDDGIPTRDFDKPSKKAASHTAKIQSRMTMRAKAGPQSSMSVGSANSSVDGDEGFENTNNKKKRKIPQSNGGLGNHHSALLADLANINLSSMREVDATAGAEESVGVDSSGQPYGSDLSPSGTGLTPSTPISLSQISRIRTPRSGRGSLDRRPLGNSTNGLNYGGASGRRTSSGLVGGKTASSHQLASSPAGKGIISSAIANAQSEELSTPVKGSENVSLLQQQLANKSPPQIDQFSFTCDDPSTNKVVWPGNTTMSATDPNYPMPPSQHPDSSRRAPPNPNGGPTQGQQQQPPPPKKKVKPGRIYELAARRRRVNQSWANQQHPPKGEDIWICEFCEYEAIYGVPPAALIRQYEKKDRKAQKALAERRRMLEKVKQKGRKNKKNAKATQKSLAHHAAEFQKREYLRNTQNVGSSAQGSARRDDDGQFEGDYPYDPERYDDVPDTEEDFVDEDEQEYGDTDDYHAIRRNRESAPDRMHHIPPHARPGNHDGGGEAQRREYVNRGGETQSPGRGYVTTEVFGH